MAEWQPGQDTDIVYLLRQPTYIRAPAAPASGGTVGGGLQRVGLVRGVGAARGPRLRCPSFRGAGGAGGAWTRAVNELSLSFTYASFFST